MRCYTGFIHGRISCEARHASKPICILCAPGLLCSCCRLIPKFSHPICFTSAFLPAHKHSCFRITLLPPYRHRHSRARALQLSPLARPEHLRRRRRMQVIFGRCCCHAGEGRVMCASCALSMTIHTARRLPVGSFHKRDHGRCSARQRVIPAGWAGMWQGGVITRASDRRGMPSAAYASHDAAAA